MDTATVASALPAEQTGKTKPLSRPVLVSIMIALLLTAFLTGCTSLMCSCHQTTPRVIASVKSPELARAEEAKEQSSQACDTDLVEGMKIKGVNPAE